MHAIHHIAIIGSDYARSRHFYVDILGFPVLNEVYRAERDSWKCDLAVGDAHQITQQLIVNTTTKPGAYPVKVSFVVPAGSRSSRRMANSRVRSSLEQALMV